MHDKPNTVVRPTKTVRLELAEDHYESGKSVIIKISFKKEFDCEVRLVAGRKKKESSNRCAIEWLPAIAEADRAGREARRSPFAHLPSLSTAQQHNQSITVCNTHRLISKYLHNQMNVLSRADIF